MSNLEVIAGGQFGSEGKGAITAWRVARARAERTDATVIGVRVAGPNAGHTVIGDLGAETAGSVAPNLCEIAGVVGDRVTYAWRLRSVPVAAVVDRRAVLVIAAGSEIDPPVLLNEIEALDRAGYGVSGRLFIDSAATVISEEHKHDEAYGRGSFSAGLPVPRSQSSVERREAEGIATTLGSTGKGIGAARADRLWREPGAILLAERSFVGHLRDALGVTVVDTGELLRGALRAADATVVVEGTQGYGLGTHARSGHGEPFYPYGTSSDCRAIDFLAMAGISPWQQVAIGTGREVAPGVREDRPELAVWVCIRPYPIRVGGNSGPLAQETSWDALGLPVEHTTVTGKVRRVGRWDGGLARRAIQENGGPGGSVRVAVTMMDSIVPGVAGWTELPASWASASGSIDEGTAKAASRLRDEVDWLTRECQSPIAAVGTGPDTVLSLASLA